MTDENHPDEVPEHEERRDRQSPAGEEELGTKTLNIQQKRFYLDVKQNPRGRFIKIAEVGSGGRKSRLLMAMSVAAEFRDHLIDFAEFYNNLGPKSEDKDSQNDGNLKSEFISKDNRRYYLDLKENQRGRFLRVAQTMARGPRTQIAIPASGMVDFKDGLTELLEHFGTDDCEASGLPESRAVRSDNKMFYFDVGTNRRGVFLRISEVRRTMRTSITIPEKSWGEFRDILDDFLEIRNAPIEDEPEEGDGVVPASGGGDGKTVEKK